MSNNNNGTAADDGVVEYDIIIVGAGIAGLSCANTLLHQSPTPLRVLILEARDRLGGRVHTVDKVDHGASWVHGSHHGADFQAARRVLVLSEAEKEQYDCTVFTSSGRDISDEFEATEDIVEECFERVESASEKRHHLSREEDIPVRGPLDQELKRKWPKLAKKLKVPPSSASLIRAVVELQTVGLEGYNACELDHASYNWMSDPEDVDPKGGDFLVLGNGYTDLVNHLHRNITTHAKHHPAVILLQHPVTHVNEEDDGGTRVHSGNGRVFRATKCVVVTIPLGCLKANTVTFTPSLSPRKQLAIKMLAFGVLDKVVLKFRRCFWNRRHQWIGYANDSTNNNENDDEKTDSGEQRLTRPQREFTWFLNLALHQPNNTTLVAFNNNSFAVQMEQLTDAQVCDRALNVLARRYGEQVVRDNFISGVATRWYQDEWSRGSYSGMQCGGVGADFDALAEPEWKNQRLRFAGEATCRAHCGTVPGAYITGQAQARQILKQVS